MNLTGHRAGCLCEGCMIADMDAAIRAQGLDPANYPVGPQTATAERTRYARPGQACGRGVVRPVSPKQVALIRRLMAERDTSKLVRLPGSEDVERMSLAGARDLIDRLMGCPELPESERPVWPASEKQLGYLRSLADRKGLDLQPMFAEPITAEGASKAIDYLRSLPDAPKPPPAAELEPGMYLVDGTVYKVQRSRESGRLYAKRLNRESQRFEYAAGAVREIKPDHRMTLEQAKQYGATYGVCCVCSATLTNEASIEAGIGPICATRI